jgi:prepilin-type N-terminal cleavage/methylation domain-containing protein
MPRVGKCKDELYRLQATKIELLLKPRLCRPYNGGVMNRQRRNRVRGTTLVELMIVVVILGVLAALAQVGYKRYIGRARLSEANSVLAELSAKEQLYFMDTGGYVPARANDVITQPSADESAAEFIPTNLTLATFESVRTAQPVPNPYPAAWRRIGMRVRWKDLYCSYLVNAGGPGQSPPASGIGVNMWLDAAGNPSTPVVPWFYAIAACNLNTADDATVPSGLPSNATFLVLTHDSPAIRTLNDGQ